MFTLDLVWALSAVSVVSSVLASAFYVVQRQSRQQIKELKDVNLNLQSELSAAQHAKYEADTQLQLQQAEINNKESQLQKYEQEANRLNRELLQTSQQLSQAQGEIKHNQAVISQSEKDAQKLIEKEQKIEQLNHELGQLKTDLKQEQVEREKEQESLQEKLELLEKNKQQLSQEFENLSNKIFDEKYKQFNQTSKEGLSSLLNPFKDQLEGLRKKVDDVYVAESKDRASLKAQIGELHKLNKQITEEASALTRALKGEKKTQGNWGELVLETVLEKSGLRAGEEYVREKSISDEGDRYRPDVIINLPEDKHIVVDAKVSLNAYTDYVNAETDSEKQGYLKAHVQAVKNHIKQLADKAYDKLQGINSPDFVFMFMPIEPAFMVAFQHDDALFNDAFEKRIVVVTPTTLLASLRTVSSLWSIERQNKHAKQLAEQASKVHDKLVGFVENMEKVGIQLGTVQKTYDTAWNQLKEGRGNLLSQAHKFKDLGVRSKKELPKHVMETAELEFTDE
ncbi:DNA recombination protein RmuC [Bermanella sp. R86510]|uniref:DNA recombination protein RmuC n=1 Tax=unclassified Bermanella TaxID=2627862 RepID=UPI0037C64220